MKIKSFKKTIYTHIIILSKDHFTCKDKQKIYVESVFNLWRIIQEIGTQQIIHVYELWNGMYIYESTYYGTQAKKFSYKKLNEMNLPFSF